MRWNEQEVSQLAQQTPEWEGRLNYRPPTKSRGPFSSSNSDPRDRWFRLRANCLFIFRLSPLGGRPPLGAEPMGVLILERFHVQKEGFESGHANSFSIIFSDDPGKKHIFIAETERHARQWEMALKRGSYQKMREHLINLQIKLTNRTGVDPLEGTVFSNNPAFTRRHNADTADAADMMVEAPKAKPRKNKSKTSTSTFQSHVVQNWEEHSPVKNQTSGYSLNNNGPEGDMSRKASFKSHVDVPVANLLDL